MDDASLDALLAAPPVPPEHRLAYGTAPSQYVDLYVPAQRPVSGLHPTVVAFHGGFWRAEYDGAHFSHACAALAREGFAVASVEYRRIGQNGGFQGTLDDAAAALALVHGMADRFALDRARVLALGHSAGGQLALWLAARRPVAALDAEAQQMAGVVALAPVADLVRGQALGLGAGVIETFLGGTPEDAAAAYVAASPAALLPLGVRQVVIHGEHDDVVPVALVEQYVHRARELGDDARLEILPGADHYCVIDPRSAQWATVVAALRGLQ